MPTVSVQFCPQPEGAPEVQRVVIADIFRASTTMITALHQEAQAILPLAHPDELKKYTRQDGWLTAGEEGGRKFAFADLGNSPNTFSKTTVQGKRIAFCTTNGTKAIHHFADRTQLLIGGFANFSVLTQYLLQTPADLLIVCAGYQSAPSLEDIFFAGTLINTLLGTYKVNGDEALIAQSTYFAHRGHPIYFLEQGSHFQRLLRMGCRSDLAFCLTRDTGPVIPHWNGVQIVPKSIAVR